MLARGSATDAPDHAIGIAQSLRLVAWPTPGRRLRIAQGVVDGESRLLLPAVLGLRGRERRRDLVNQPPPNATVPRQGRGTASAAPRRCRTGSASQRRCRRLTRCPRAAHQRLMLDLGSGAGPDCFAEMSSSWLSSATWRSRTSTPTDAGSLRHGASEPVHDAAGAVVHDCDAQGVRRAGGHRLSP